MNSNLFKPLLGTNASILARQLSIRSLMGQKNTAYTLLQMHRQTMQHVASQVGLECLLAVQ